MGLDLVEMFMRVEETFNISIPDKDCETLTTVGALYRYVLDKIESTHPKACLTSFTFYRVRRALMETFNLPRNQIKPDTPLDTIIPIENLQAQWYRFKETMGPSIPALEWPPGIRTEIVQLSPILMIMGSLFVMVFILLSAFPVTIKFWLASALIVACISSIYVIDFLFRPRRRLFPKDCPDVGALTKWILGKNFKEISQQQRKWTDADVWATLRVVITEELSGLKLEDVVPEARFIEDLGAG